MRTSPTSRRSWRARSPATATRASRDGITGGMAAPRVLHVLPHAGGGGETYVEQLRSMPGFRFERLELTRRRRPMEAPAGIARLLRSARDHDLIHVHGDSAA